VIALVPIVEMIYQDASGSTAALTFRVPIGSTVSTALGAANALGAVVAPLTGCTLVKLRIKYILREAEPATPADGSSVKRCGVFIYDNIDTTHQALIKVPGILDSVLRTDEPGAGVLIDTDNSDIAVFDGVVVADGFCDPFGTDLGTLVAAYRQSRV
jgi:hypothetical protein